MQLISLVLERLVVVVDVYLLNPLIAFDGADHMPALPPTAFDEFSRSVPGVE
jgi:hypothetical protein